MAHRELLKTSRRLVALMLLGALMVVAGSVGSAEAFDERDTHPRLTEASLRRSLLDATLRNDLGITGGLDAALKGQTGEPQTVLEWARRGARGEDIPTCRASNHFHNPLLPFDRSGVGDLPFSGLCRASFGRIHSNVTWATRFVAPAEVGPDTGNPFDWSAARRRYLEALTTMAPIEREAALARTFETLGHLMHLVQDLAVPAHVRNDFMSHLDCVPQAAPVPNWCLNAFERFVQQRPGLVDIVGTTPISFDGQLVTRFWDLDRYTGANPSADLAQGLAEYTNANFASLYTLFTESLPAGDLRAFPFPRLSSTDLEDLVAQRIALRGEVEAGANLDDRLLYLSKINDGERITPFAKVGYLTKFLMSPAFPGVHPFITHTFQIDDAVHDAYALKLLPRAIGYGTGLVDYFFRGKIDYVVDPATPGNYLIQNLGREDMSGTFKLYYDAKDGRRKPVPGRNGGEVVWPTNWQATAGSLPAGVRQQMSVTPDFDPPADAKTLSEYMLVFTGEMGQETPANSGVGAVVGKAIKNPYLGGLYLAGLDANNQILSLKVDPSGVTVLSGFDISQADSAHPDGVFVGNFGKFDPLQRVLGTMAFEGFSTLPKSYLTKQASIDPTTGLHQPLSASFVIQTFSGPRIFSFLPSRPSNVTSSQVRWIANSPDPALGTFEFLFVGTSTSPQDATLAYTRQFTLNGAPQSTSGELKLPKLTSPESYAQFFDAAKPLLISGDGTLIAGFARRSNGAGGILRTQVRIALGATPTATLESTLYREETVQIQPPSLTNTVVGSCSITVRRQDGTTQTLTSEKRELDEFAGSFEVRYSEEFPFDFLNGSLAKYTLFTRNKSFNRRHFIDCVVGGDDWNGTAFVPKFHIDRVGETISHNSSLQLLQFQGGDFPNGQLDPPLTHVTTEVLFPGVNVGPVGLTRIQPGFGGNGITQYTHQYDGGSPIGPLFLTISVPDSLPPAQQVVRPLTLRRDDVIYAEPATPGGSFTVHKFRGMDVTNTPYVADASAVGEVFFATSDLSTIIHEPKQGSMPVIDRSQLPANLVRLLAAFWF